jgi:catechol 2,3-dioxygenase-like lactoylglutathione lyase family enzyme
MISTITGVHHVGMGVRNFVALREFYEKTLEMTEIFMEFPEVWNAMPDVFRTSQHKFFGAIVGQKSGGILVELLQLSVPLPRPIRSDTRYGDIGVNKTAIAVGNVEKFYREFRNKMNFLSDPKSIMIPNWGEHRFVYAKDPEDNLLEFFSNSKGDVEGTYGGVQWLGIAVTDLERSMDFYQSYAFDIVLAAPHEKFSGMVDEVAGLKDTQVRSCLLGNSNGGGMIELYEVLKPRGRSFPLNARWGDFGYLELCLACNEMHELAAFCRKQGIVFLHSPAIVMEGKEADWWFQYVYDPDGIPVETIGEVPKTAA